MQKILMLNGKLNQSGIWSDTTDQVNKFLDEGWKINKIIPLASASQGSFNIDASGSDAGNDISLNNITEGCKVFVAIIQLEKN